jgi:hypothetical protein
MCSPYILIYLKSVTLQITFLFTMDPKALSHILMDRNLYQKPELARYALGRLLGNGRTFGSAVLSNITDNHWILGLLVAEGDKHRQQVLIPQTDGNVSAD